MDNGNFPTALAVIIAAVVVGAVLFAWILVTTVLTWSLMPAS